jgi:signal recognition particle subunit SRP54
MASRILGMGDVLTLIEQAEQAFEEGQAEAAAAKMGTGELTLEDFLEQMMAVRKMGPIANVLGMLPGANQMKDQLAGLDEKHLDRVQAIIRGMTPAERDDPKIINGSRRLRIANGSGVGVSDVNQLVERFFEARKMMKNMAGQFGLPGMGGGRKGKRQAAKAAKNVRKGPKQMPAIAGIAQESTGDRGERSVGSYQTPGLNQLPPALAGMNELPAGFDPGALSFPGNSGGSRGGGGSNGGGKKGNRKKRK